MNHLYVYPAHRDWTPERGDLFPANTPYLLVSRGSSGSDRPFLEALALILAAFRPDTKARLVAGGPDRADRADGVPPLAPVVTSREAYLGGDAHPAAFAGTEINAARMVSLANADRADAIPPQVRLAVLEEDLGQPRRRLLRRRPLRAALRHPGRGRPGLARQGRPPLDPGLAPPRPATRTAATSPSTGGSCRAIPAKVPIEPLGDGATARITLDWHDPFPVSEDDPTVDRAHRRRGLRLERRARQRPGDPQLVLPAERGAAATPPAPTAARRGSSRSTTPTRAAPRPTPTRSSCRAPTGATNSPPTPPAASPAGPATATGREPEAFTADGARILDRDAAGAPTRVEAVAYPLGRDAAGRLVVEELSTGAYLDYQAAPGP